MNAFFAEFFGTAMILVFGGGVVANVLLNKTKGNNSGWIVITFGWAVGVFTGVSIAAPYSGAHLNPAITLALVMAHKFSPELMPMYILAQTLGAMFGAFLVWLAYKKHLMLPKMGIQNWPSSALHPISEITFIMLSLRQSEHLYFHSQYFTWLHQKLDLVRSMHYRWLLLCLAWVCL